MPRPFDPYATLRVPRSATARQIARAYHDLAKALHPDLHGRQTEPQMGAVNRAWRILSDPRRRAEWDGDHPAGSAASHWVGRPAASPSTNAFYTTRNAWPMPDVTRGSARRSRADSEQGRPAQPHPTAQRTSRSLPDSGWLAAAVGAAIVVGLLAAAGIAAGLTASRDGAARELPPRGTPASMQRAIAGTALVVRFNAIGYGRLDVLGAGAVVSDSFPCAGGTTMMGFPETAEADESFVRWDAASGTYAYVWKTDPGWAQSCRRLAIDVDGAIQDFYFDFRTD
jgi:hypothetical protein